MTMLASSMDYVYIRFIKIDQGLYNSSTKVMFSLFNGISTTGSRMGLFP